MNTTPTREQVALEAARATVAEFSALREWLSYEDQLARELLKDPTFVCTVDYAIQKVQEHIRWNKQMQGRAAQVGGGARGVALVAGMIVGEWLGGHTTVDRELDSW